MEGGLKNFLACTVQDISFPKIPYSLKSDDSIQGGQNRRELHGKGGGGNGGIIRTLVEWEPNFFLVRTAIDVSFQKYLGTESKKGFSTFQNPTIHDPFGKKFIWREGRFGHPEIVKI